MFKKSKKELNTPPPAPPTADEILEDLETFNVMLASTPTPNDDGSKQNSPALTAWWTQFEKFTDNLKDLIVVRDLINTYKLKLESSKIELQTQTKLFTADIDEQQIVVQQALE